MDFQGASLDVVLHYLKEIDDKNNIDAKVPYLLWQKYEKEKEGTTFIECVIELSRIWSPVFPYIEPHIKKIILHLLASCIKNLQLGPEDLLFEVHVNILKWMSQRNNLYLCCSNIGNCNDSLFKILKSMFVVQGFGPVSFEKEFLAISSHIIDLLCQPFLPDDVLSYILKHYSHVNTPSDIIQFADEIIFLKSKEIQTSLYQVYFDFFNLGVRRTLFKCYDDCYIILNNISQRNSELTIDIIPLIEPRLRSQNVTARKQAIKFFGRIITLKSMKPLKNKTIWKTFLARFLDVASCVIACVENVPSIITSHPELYSEILEVLCVVQRSNNQGIKMKVLECAMELARKDIWLVDSYPEFWNMIFQRIHDPMGCVMYQTLDLMGLLFEQLADKTFLLEGTQKLKQKCCEIILTSYLKNHIKYKSFVANHIQTIIGYESQDDDFRMTRLLEVLLYTSDKAFNGFVAFQYHQLQLQNNVFGLISYIKEKDNFDQDSLENFFVSILKFVPVDEEVMSDLTQFCFVLKEDQSALNEISLVINPLISIKTRHSNLSNLFEKFEDLPFNLVKCIKNIFKRLFYFLDVDSLNVLLMKIESLFHEYGQVEELNQRIFRAMNVLEVFAATLPGLFVNSNTLSYLLSFVQKKSPSILRAISSLSIYPGVCENCQALAEQHEILSLCESFLREGPPKLIKETMKFMYIYFSENDSAMGIIEQVIKDGHSSNSLIDNMRSFVSRGYFILQIMEKTPTIISNVQTIVNEIYKDLYKKLLHGYEDNSSVDYHYLQFWHDQNELSLLSLYKCEAVKVFSALLEYLNNPSNAHKYIVSLIEYVPNLLNNECSAGKCWIHYNISKAIIKVSNRQDPSFNYPLYYRKFFFITFMVSDTKYLKLIFKKISKYMLDLLPLEFLEMFCIVTLKEDPDLTDQCLILFQMIISKRRTQNTTKEPGEMVDQVDEVIIKTLILLMKGELLLDMNEGQLLGCLRFTLQALVRSQPHHLDYYFNIIQIMNSQLQAPQEVAKELKKLVNSVFLKERGR